LWIEEDSFFNFGLLFPPPTAAEVVYLHAEPYKDVYSITYKNNEMVFKTYV